MSKKNSRAQAKVFSRRVAILGAGKALLISTLLGRLYYLQVIEADKYKTLSDENRINLRLLPPLRGLILDRFGKVMAANNPDYRAVLIAERTPDLARTLDAFSSLIPVSDKERTRILKERQRNRAFVPIPVKEDLNWEEVSLVEINLPDLPGITIEADQKRYYPEGAPTAHLLGYVAAPSEDEVARDPDPLLQLPGFRIGKNGLEKQYDAMLRGKAGASEVEVNSLGRVMRELSRTEGMPGRPLVTSIDLGLQAFVHQRLGDQLSAAAVVMDIFNGDVLAMASVPAYDPAAFYRGLTAAEWQQLTTNAYTPLINKAIAGQYAPGSTFKLVTAAAALEAGIDPGAAVFCSGSMALGGALFHCWKKEGHGAVDMTGAIQHSCDVYFYDVARRIGIDVIANMARRLGLGKPTGLDLPGEKSGLIPDRAWKKATLHDSWHPGENLVAGIGQGFIQATPLQLCVMAARIANGGYAVKPHLTRMDKAALSGRASGPSPYPLIGLNGDWLHLVRQGMDMVTNDGSGTAYRSRITIPGMEMAGKTGTSQVRRISMAERSQGVRKNEDLPWNQRDHALFVAFAPVAAPRYACAVVVEHGGGGSAVAAPIARDILIYCQQNNSAALMGDGDGDEGVADVTRDKR